MCRIILTGIKHSGKSTVGWALSSRLGLFFADLDDLILRDSPEYMSIRQLFRERGKSDFQARETSCLEHFLLANREKSFVLSLGGGTVENSDAVRILKNSDTRICYLHADEKVLFDRIIRGGIPPFLEGPDPEAIFREIFRLREKLYRNWADYIIDTRGKSPAEITEEIAGISGQT